MTLLKKKEDNQYRDLFLKEEFKGDRLINYLRFFISIILVLLALTKADLFKGIIISLSLIFTLSLISVAILYTVILFFLYRKEIYHPFIKYVSITVDITLVVLSIFAYKLEPPIEYAKIFFLARFSILFLFIFLSILRYNFWLSLYSGILGAIEYFVFIILNNKMTGKPFSFISEHGITHYSQFSSSEIYFRIAYILIAGILTAIAADRFKKLIINSLIKEQEKNKLLMDNKIIETVNKENKKYLDNIKEGLLLINKNYLIKGQFSKYLIDIFEADNFVGTNFIDFIFPDNNEYEDKRKELEKFITIMFKETLADFDMLMDVNPLSEVTIKINDKNGSTKEKVISASFYKIYRDDKIEDIMVIFEDKTRIIRAKKELENEKNKRQTEIESIQAILKMKPESLLEFIEDSNSTLSDIEINIEKLEDINVLNSVFREIHSLKGNSRTFNFTAIAKIAHNIEDILSKFRDNLITINYEIKSQIKSMINNIYNEFDNIKKLQDKFKQFINMNISIDHDSNELNTFLESIKNMTLKISNELDKEINFKIINTLDHIPNLKDIKNPITHLIRNSIDHGIEDKFERISKEKNEKGNIAIKLYKDEINYIIEIFDDGSGIDFSKIKKNAVKKGLINESENVPNSKLFNLLFSPGFSTSDEVTDISGRGVGLDVVKDTINKLKGNISVNTQKDKGTKFIIKIPLN